MTRLTHAWRQLEPEQRLAAVAALGLLVTMFLPWYGLQSLNPKTHAIYSHNISAFGDVSFVEAAIFLVAAGVGLLLFARAEGRDFQLPGGDGSIVLLAGGWAAVLIFFRVFSRPAGDGYPVGIEWGFFLAFVAAGTLAFAGWRMRASERPEPPLTRGRGAREDVPAAAEPAADAPAGPRPHRSTPVPARGPSSVPAPREPAAGAPDRPGPPASAPGPAPGDSEPSGDAPTEVTSKRPAAERRERLRARQARTEPLDAPEQLSFEDPPARQG